MNTHTPLQLLTPAEYAADRPQIFPGLESLRWFERMHRTELVECGALLKPTGRKLVNPSEFDAAVVRIGKRMATPKAER